MGNINRTARGLLSLLDSQTQGSTPDELQTNVQGSIGLEPYLYSSKGFEFVHFGNFAVNSKGTGGFIVVPQDQIWHVFGQSVGWYNAAVGTTTTYAAVSLGLSPDQTINISSVLAPEAHNVNVILNANGDGTSVEWHDSVPLVAQPGWTFFWSVDHISTPPITLGFNFDHTLRIVRLAI